MRNGSWRIARWWLSAVSASTTGTPTAIVNRIWSSDWQGSLTLASPKRDEREVGLELLARSGRRGGELLICDKGYAGRAFAAAVADLGATVARPARKDEAGRQA